MKTVDIKVEDEQIYDTYSEKAKNQYSGSLAIKGNNIYLTYKEKQTGVNNVVKVMGDEVSVTRSGSINGKLEFGKDKVHFTTYVTPFGKMKLEMRTNSIFVNANEHYVSIKVTYDLYSEEQKLSENRLVIKAQ